LEIIHSEICATVTFAMARASTYIAVQARVI
jgi:hypothetical protein